jgi:hypothetical protein
MLLAKKTKNENFLKFETNMRNKKEFTEVEE